MAKPIKEVMTPNPTTLNASSTVVEASRAMREKNIGDVIIQKDGKLFGILTDRDIVVRVIAEARDPNKTVVGEICSRDLTALSSNNTDDDAVRVMREKALRRLPVVDNGRCIGIVSLGDLAQERDRQSVLGAVSAAPPNR